MVHRQERIVISSKDAEQILKQGNEEIQNRVNDGWILESRSFVPESIDTFSFIYCIGRWE